MSEFSDPTHPNASDNHPLNQSCPGEDEIENFGRRDGSWQRVFEDSLPGLRAFLRNRLGQETDVDDCLQVVSVTMIEKGAGVAPSARRAWLFRVAANESARIWRKRASTDKALKKYADDTPTAGSPEEALSRKETSESLQQALNTLPTAWQQVVRLRIHENLTFQQIADQLDIPLGTALTQMRRALERMKQILDPDES